MPTVIYGIDDSNNKFETLTKEQILTAIAEAQQGRSVMSYESAFISKIKELNHGYQLRFWVGTQADYNAISEPENNVLYIISDDTSKEEIMNALDNLSETVSGIVDVLPTKQNNLTFDAMPTAESLNPVYSGGVYQAINNAKVQRDELWVRPTMINTDLREAGDTVTLAANISNYDFVEFHIAYPASGWDDCGIQTFTASNGGVLRIHWTELQADSSGFSIVYDNVKLQIDDDVVTINSADHCSTTVEINSRLSGTSVTHAVFNRIYKIVGVKLP